MLDVNAQSLLIQSLYILELLKTSLNSERIELINKIGKEICRSLTPELIAALHRQKKDMGFDMGEIKSSIASILSGSGSLEITRVFVAISNGDGIYQSLDMEIKLVFRSILGSILAKLEENTIDTDNGNAALLDDYTIPPSIAPTDPSYRLLRLILFTSNQQMSVAAIVRVLTSVRTPQE